MQKKQQGIFVTGTDTDVGKTWLGQIIIRQLCEQGIKVIPRKPVESGWSIDEETSTDGWLLAKAAHQEHQLDLVCPNRFKAAISPVRAAAMEQKTLHLETVKQQCIQTINNDEFLYVEGAGGFFSPLVSDGLNADLAKSLGLPVLLIAENKLGCINHILLSIAAIRSYQLPLVAIVLNTREKTMLGDMNNFEDLQSLVDIPVFQMQYQQGRIDEAFLQLLLEIGGNPIDI